MRIDKILSNLREIQISIEEIEEFYSSYFNSEDESIKKMAIRAIERKVEIIDRNWTTLKKHSPDITSTHVINFRRISTRMSSGYTAKPNTQLILSVINTNLADFNKEINQLIKDFQLKDDTI